MSSTPNVPAPPPRPPSPVLFDEEMMEARRQERRRQMVSSGMRSTILTGPQGATSRPTLGTPTLLGAKGAA
jgi:hypothetical protein